MALNANSSALMLNLPGGNGVGSTSRPTPPSLITLHPSVLAQILDHHTRQSTSTSTRVIGTLLGHHLSSDELEVKSSFAVPHSEDEEQVAVDMDYLKGMMELVGRLGGKGVKAAEGMGGAGGEVIVGWYSSSASLTPYSALIQNFFSQECAAASPSSAAFGAVHLCVDLAGKEGGGLGVKGYWSMQVGNNPKPENCVFVPIPVSLKYNMSERAGLDLLLPTASSKQSAPDPSLPPLSTLSNSLSLLSTQLAQIQTYVSAVASGQTEGDEAVGRYLLDAVGRWKADGQGKEEEGVKEGVRELLSVSYLSALVRSQVELSGRLGLLN